MMWPFSKIRSLTRDLDAARAENASLDRKVAQRENEVLGLRFAVRSSQDGEAAAWAMIREMKGDPNWYWGKEQKPAVAG